MLDHDKSNNKEAVKLSIQAILEEKDECIRRYEGFNYVTKMGEIVRHLSERVNQFEMPSLYQFTKSKINQ